jgi:hypothetical protein
MTKRPPLELFLEDGRKGYYKGIAQTHAKAEEMAAWGKKWFGEDKYIVIKKINIGTEKKPEYSYAVYDVK